MKMVMVFDQIQAGAGIKDVHMVFLGLLKGAVGPAIMMEPYLKTYNGQILACLYCGDGYYAENEEMIAAFKDCIPLVKTPKKGGVGLDASLRAMCEVAHALYTGVDIQPFKQTYCF